MRRMIWYARTYLWAPSMMVMHLGETVLLEFFGINGEQHPSEIRAPDGAVIAEFEVARGEIAQVPFSPNMAGIHEFVSTQRLPGMVWTNFLSWTALNEAVSVANLIPSSHSPWSNSAGNMASVGFVPSFKYRRKDDENAPDNRDNLDSCSVSVRHHGPCPW